MLAAPRRHVDCSSQHIAEDATGATFGEASTQNFLLCISSGSLPATTAAACSDTARRAIDSSVKAMPRVTRFSMGPSVSPASDASSCAPARTVYIDRRNIVISPANDPAGNPAS